MPTKTNAVARKMAHAHTAALGSLITVCPPVDIAFSARNACHGIGPVGARGLNSQNLNSSSQTVMRVESEADRSEWSSVRGEDVRRLRVRRSPKEPEGWRAT